MIFNDALFFALRVTTMVKQGHAYFGVIFASKECVTLIVRFLMLLAERSLVISKTKNASAKN